MRTSRSTPTTPCAAAAIGSPVPTRSIVTSPAPTWVATSAWMRYEDLVVLREGDACPVDGGQLHIGRSIVVGHIYQLGTKYSEPLEATFTEEDGTEQVYCMGCYGIGISRILAAAAEQYHDDDGLDAAQGARAVRGGGDPGDPRRRAGDRRGRAHLRRAARRRVSSVALDDRDERAGVKFADADLIGYPVQVTVGKRGHRQRHGGPEAPGDGRAHRRTPRRGRPGRDRRSLATGTAEDRPGSDGVAARWASAILTFVQSEEVCPEVGSRPPSRS